MTLSAILYTLSSVPIFVSRPAMLVAFAVIDADTASGFSRRGSCSSPNP